MNPTSQNVRVASTIRRDPMKDSELKFALIVNVERGERKEYLETLNKQHPLAEFVERIRLKFDIKETKDLEIYLSQKRETSEYFIHITEENRDEIKAGDFLHLIRNPAVTAEEITSVLYLEKETVDWNVALKELHSKYLTYPQFTAKFIEMNGHQRLLELLGSGKCNDENHTNSAQVKTLCYQAGLFYNALMAVRVLFKNYGLPGTDHEHGMISWDLITENVLSMVISGLKFGEVTYNSLECCYDLLDHCIRRLPDKADFIVQKVDSKILFTRLINEVDEKRMPKKEFQICFLNFLNTIFRHAKSKGNEIEKVCTLLASENRNVILKCVPALRGQEEVQTNNAMLGPLVEFQQHLLCLQAKKCSEALDPEDMNRMNTLNMMRSLVNDGESTNRLSIWQYSSVEIEHFRALGFENCEQPYKDFDVSHGGILAFECVDNFIKFSKESEELLTQKSNKGGSQFPFIRASGILTSLLARKFRLIGDMDNQFDPVNETDFFPLLFSQDKAFEQVFSKCIVAFARTWRDMRAAERDMETVRKVLAEQLAQTFSMREYRERLSSLDTGLQKFNYAEILRLQDKKEEEKRKNRAVSEEIRESLRERINKYIYENRVNHMQRGQKFTLYESSFFNMKGKATGANPTLFVRLDRYMKHLYYEKSEAKQNPDKSLSSCKADDRLSATSSTGKLDEMEKISLANIKDIHFGNKCHAHTGKKLPADLINNCITLVVQTETSDDENSRNMKDINLIAPEINTLNIWMDGLHSLMHKGGRSSLHDRDFERLACLEEKVRCLQLPAMHDITRRPNIPPDPLVFPMN